MQRKWRRDWERSKARHGAQAGPPGNPFKALVRSIIAPVVAAGILLGGMSGAYANPTDGTIINGSGTISSSGSTMTINQNTNKMSINWQSFSIGSGETVNFIQPNSSSIALNRVIGNDASSIYGTLTANGKVFLINPNGILFAPGAKVDVGGLVASTLDISDSDFMNGRYKFTGRDGTIGTVVNQGTITAANGGYVALLGTQVKNEGVIVAQQGTVALGAGKAMTLDMDGDGLLNLAVDQGAVNASAANHNLIQADGGQVIMVASAAGDLAGTVVNNSGVIQARSVSSVNGTIRLDGGTNGTVINSGTLDASGKNAGETGGTVKVLGQTVALANGTKIDASGANGGGTVLVGGNAQGKGPEQNATTTTVAANATINADAITSGNGGKVVVWADDTTKFDGSISAKGGSQSGNGGSVETSGHTLTVGDTARVTTLAAKGTAGNWLLDPYDFNIGGTTPDITVANLVTALNGGNVTIQTTATAPVVTGVSGSYTGTAGSGDINVNDAVGWGSAYSLTLSAYNNVNVNAAITNTGSGGVNLTAGNDVNVNAAITTGGAVALRAVKDVNVNNAVTSTGGGAVVLRADSDADGSGTVAFDATTGRVKTDGAVSIYYNPASKVSTTIGGSTVQVNSYANKKDYAPYVSAYTSGNTANLTAYMLINNVYDLQYIGTSGTTETGIYALGKDINASATSSWNSSAGFAPIVNFTGIFDGDGHAISGLYINSISSAVGLFANANNAVIRNVGLENVNINIANAGYKSKSGALVGIAFNTSIENCYSTGRIVGDHILALGGLVGYNSGSSTITNSYSTATVTNNNSGYDNSGTGGLVGINVSGSSITNSYSAGTVYLNNASGNFDSGVGGLVGYNAGGVNNSYSSGAVQMSSDNSWLVGGLVGSNDGSIQNSYSTTGLNVDVNSNGNVVGGFVGMNGGSITDCYSSGAVTGINNMLTGGFIGYLAGGGITGSYWDMDTSGQSQGSGDGSTGSPALTGLSSTTGSSPFASSSYSWFTNGTSPVWYMVEGSTRPFLRSEYSKTISNSHQLQLMALDLSAAYTLAANISMRDTAMWKNGFVPIGSGDPNTAGSTPFTGTFNGNGYKISGLTITNPLSSSSAGLFGYVRNGTISNVGLSGGTVTGGAGNLYVGSLVGYNEGGTITGVYSTATVSGTNIVGGLVGTNTGSITDSYFALGTVTGSSAGGIAGANSGTITCTYSNGAVTGSTTGGLVGDNTGGTVVDSVWDTQKSGQSNGVGSGGTVTNVKGLTTAEMAVSTNYPSSWDFTTTWSLTGARPLLLWQYQNGGLITTADQLAQIIEDPGGVYTLGADINLYGVSWVPIGDASTYFSGTLDGNGFTISNLSIGSATSPYVGTYAGLFGYTKGATISSITLTGVSITTGTGNLYVGSLVGYSGTGTSITKSSSSGTITANGASTTVGGLVGYNEGGITNSYNTAAVTAYGTGSTVGGLVGYNTGIISGSYNTADVAANGNSSYVGGLVGINNNSVVTTGDSITGSYNTGNVTSNADDYVAGGLVGENDKGGIVKSYNTGTVKNTSTTSTIPSAKNKIGGLVGINNSTIASSYNDALVTASGDSSTVGGLVGLNGTTGSIANSYSGTHWTKATGNTSKAGGLAGENDGSIDYAYTVSPVSSTGSGSTAGALIGLNGTTGTTTANTYWNSEIASGAGLNGVGSDSNSAGDKARGLTVANMMQSGSYNNWSTNWGTTWGIIDGTSFPYLQWQFSGRTPQFISGTVQDGGVGKTVGIAYSYFTPTAQIQTAETTTLTANGFYYMTAPASMSLSNTNQIVTLYVTGDSSYKANGFYRLGTYGLSGGDLTNNTVIVNAGSSPTHWTAGSNVRNVNEFTFGDMLQFESIPSGDCLVSYTPLSGTPSSTDTAIYSITGDLQVTNVALSNPGNSITATGSITINTSGDFIMNKNFGYDNGNIMANNLSPLRNVYIYAGKDLTINAGGSIVLRHGATLDYPQLSAGGNVTLTVGTAFLNEGGSNAIKAGYNYTTQTSTGSGYWRVYAPDQLIYSSNRSLYYDDRGYDTATLWLGNIWPTDYQAVDGRGGLTGDFVLWGGQTAPATGSGFIFAAANPAIRTLTPALLARKDAIDEAHFYNIQRLGSPVAPATVHGFTLDNLPFLTIIGQGVAVNSTPVGGVTAGRQTEKPAQGSEAGASDVQ